MKSSSLGKNFRRNEARGTAKARARGGGLAVLTVVATLAIGPWPRGWAAGPSEWQRVGLVISGGVSEGAYQAGATYALMRFLILRREEPELLASLAPGTRDAVRCGLAGQGKPRFDVAAGSSAGNINAFLAAITWCDRSNKKMGPRQNLFWDSWMNVDWQKLSPSKNHPNQYAKLFAEDQLLSTDKFAETARHLAPLGAQGSIYSDEDGLVTRRAFSLAEQNLTERIEKDAYPACDVHIGLTATRAQKSVIKLGQKDIHAQRYVLPLHLGRRGKGDAPLEVRNILPLDLNKDDPEHALYSAGLSFSLPIWNKPPNAGQVPMKSVLEMITASSAFPIAFAPVKLAHCLPPKADTSGLQVDPNPDLGCADGRSPVFLDKFIDGGLFDNQPFGLAQVLAKSARQELDEPSGAAADQDGHTLFFIDVSPVRHEVTVPSHIQMKNGLSLLSDIAGQRVSQVRGYENLGVAGKTGGAHPEIQVRTSSRFFPIVANRLVASFGAFMHPSFRVHDYFVGVYDGIYWAAQSLDHPMCNDPVKLASDVPAPSAATFHNVANKLVGIDPHLLAFVNNLFDYERQWTGVAGELDLGSREAPRDFCTLPRPPRPVSAPWREDQHVDDVFKQLCEIDQKARRLERQGAYRDLARHLDNDATFVAFARKLPAKEFLGDVDTWIHATTDRLLRRAIDIERSDQRAGANDRAVEQVALVGRLAAASALERDGLTLPVQLDWSSSSVERIAGRRWTPGRVVFSLVPNTLVWDSVNSRGMAGWEPKLRFDWKRTYVPFAFLGEVYPYADSRPPYRFGFTAHLGGVGWDPEGRTIDDVQLALTTRRRTDNDDAREWGLELGSHFLGSKLRLAVGLPQLFSAPTDPDGPRDYIRRFYVSIGLGDLNGTLYWLARSAFGYAFPSHFCEEGCDGVPLTTEGRP